MDHSRFPTFTQIPTAQRSSAPGLAVERETNNASLGETPPEDDQPVEGFICPDCRKRFLAPDALVAHFEAEHTGIGYGGGTRAAADAAGTRDDIGAVGSRYNARASIENGVGTDGTPEGDGRNGTNNTPGSSLKEQLFGRRTETDANGTTPSGTRGAGGNGGGVVAEQKAFMAAQDDYLDSVGQAVAELGLLGRNIGASLEGQAATVDRVADKTEESNDRMAFVTRKAARRAQSAKPKKPTFVMSLALQVRKPECDGCAESGKA